MGRGVTTRVLAETDVRSDVEPATETLQAPLEQPQLDGRPERIGVLGGTFDPPHLGHLVLAAAAVEELALDRLLFVPAGMPPHKRRATITSATDRLLLTRLAIAGERAFELSAIEVERPGVSYTVETLDELRRTLGDGVELTLVMAADAFAAIDTWREPDRLLDEIEWAVGPRVGTDLPDRPGLEERFGSRASRIHLLAGPSLDVSSSEIRRRVAAGHTIRYLVPRDVEELIIDRELYRRG